MEQKPQSKSTFLVTIRLIRYGEVEVEAKDVKEARRIGLDEVDDIDWTNAEGSFGVTSVHKPIYGEKGEVVDYEDFVFRLK